MEGRAGYEGSDITKLNDQTFMLKLNMISNGMLIEQEQTIHLPEKAKMQN